MRVPGWVTGEAREALTGALVSIVLGIVYSVLGEFVGAVALFVTAVMLLGQVPALRLLHYKSLYIEALEENIKVKDQGRAIDERLIAALREQVAIHKEKAE